jgi:phosphohistidine phosphatase
MKTLVLMRHAKAEKSQKDRERGLTNEGRNEATLIAEKLAEAGIKPDIILTSDARRARETALIAGDMLGAMDQVKTSEALYEGGLRDYVKTIASIVVKYETALIVGHNPSISDAAAMLCDGFTSHFSTAAALGVEFDGAIREGSGKELFFFTAK